MRYEHREVLDPQAPGLVDRHGVSGRGRFEANCEEHHFAVGVLNSQFERVEG